ncbi:MAG: methylated-DNA--[protein]-cysteine S-methyltransferase [Runella slithyformis]|nr:MAG: methylated-DNA--[protein]-cysteine S-methyltransferase [Runella slithyformis]TAF43181.1 MAG: methylated-DNA--[protein]-cysteine S-methyltransferase [Runella slithyformis]TAF79420.1 MAG: methylated-DNA--[protein]-cysteine S-methyltransferase [Runella slithyformis]
MLFAHYSTPLGLARIEGDADGIRAVTITDAPAPLPADTPPELAPCVQQLAEYFAGKRTVFDLKLNPQGTDFQKNVWQLLAQVPFGSTRSYLEQARHLGDEKAIRAVASANGKNPIWLIIPCHRIVGSNGSLTGYAGGLWRKKWLIEFEKGSRQGELF